MARRMLLTGSVLVLIGTLLALLPRKELTDLSATISQAEVTRRAELLKRLIEAYEKGQLAATSSESLGELCSLADHRVVREDGNVLYIFSESGISNQEGQCMFHLIVDERKACAVAIDAMFVCPEW
jgi:hypothetical protein